jgi:molecular chaperone GrpE
VAEESERNGGQTAQPENGDAPPGNGSNGASAQAQVEAGAEAAAPPAQPNLAAALEQARKEAAEHYERWLRLQAEFENYKRRMHKEQQETMRYAQLPLLRDLTGVMDNLERAISHARGGNHAEQQSILAGLELVTKQIGEVFERFGMTRIAAKGETFDPHRHEAMKVVESGEHPDNTVVEEFRAGYVLHDRVVRPSMVVVSKKPQAPAGSEQATAAAGGGAAQ